VRVGGGKHREHPPGYGDTLHMRGIRKHPDRDEYAYELGPDPKKAEIGKADKDKHKAAKAKDAPLDASWTPKALP